MRFKDKVFWMLVGIVIPGALLVSLIDASGWKIGAVTIAIGFANWCGFSEGWRRRNGV